MLGVGSAEQGDVLAAQGPAWSLAGSLRPEEGLCGPQQDTSHLIYSPPPSFQVVPLKTLDVKLHTGCPSDAEVNWKQSGDQERWCPPRDGHVPFSTAGQPGERSSKEGRVDRGRGLGEDACRPTSRAGAPDLMPHPGANPQTLPPRGRPRTHVGCTYAREGREKEEANQPQMRRTELLTVQKATQRHNMQTRGATHVPRVRGPSSLHPHHPGALRPPP